jgi:phosphate transport system substrate-binding protein
MRLIKKSITSIAIMAMAPAVFAAPSTVLYGGGATLPAIGYAGDSWLSANPDQRLSPAGNTGSLFGIYTSLVAGRPTVSYCQTGSGTGRGVITGARNATAACPDVVASTNSPVGFQAPTADAHFAASDAPISATEFNTGVTNKGATRGQPVQFPATAGSIAIIYNNSSLTKQLNLTESQICQIWAGQITNWSQLGAAALPIKLVYRADGSGTSFGFSNHLSYVCPSTVYSQPTQVSGFSTQSAFVSAFVGGVAPAGSIAATGNGGVTSTVNSTPGAIGYAEVANAISTAKFDPAAAVQYATVSLFTGGKKKNPAKNPKAFTIPTGSLKTDMVLGSNDGNGRPVLQALTAPTPGCVFVIDPAAYATSTLVLTNGVNDYKQYPIVAVSYLLGYYKGYGEDTDNVKALLASPYNPDVKTASDSADYIGSATGLSFLGGVNLKNNIIGTNKIPACINQ